MPELLPEDPVPGRHLNWDGHVLDILGDSLPEGRYYFQAQVEFRGDTLRTLAGNVDLRRGPRTAPSVVSKRERNRQDSATIRSGSTPGAESRLPPPPPPSPAPRPLAPPAQRS